MSDQLGPQLDRALRDAAKRAVRTFFLGNPHPELETLLARVADAAASRAVAHQVHHQAHPHGFKDPAIGGRLLIPGPDAAAMAGIGSSTMWDLIRRGVVETATLGRRRLVVVESLHKLIDERRRAPKEALTTPPVGRGRRPRSNVAPKP